MAHQDDYVTANGQQYFGPEREITEATPGRMYLEVTKAGKIKKQKDALFPHDFPFPTGRGRKQTWPCSVRGCEKLSIGLLGLGNHWRGVHKFTAFNDNCDGSLSPIGVCDKSMVVQRERREASPGPSEQISQSRRRATAKRRATANRRLIMRRRQNGESQAPRPAFAGSSTVAGNNANGDRANQALEHENEDFGLEHDSDPDQNSTSSAALAQKLMAFHRVRLARGKELMRQMDSRVCHNRRTVGMCATLVEKQHSNDERVFVLSTQFWPETQQNNGDGDVDPSVPMPTRDHLRVVVPIFNGTYWLSVFVERRQTPQIIVLFSVLDPTGSRKHDNIIGLLRAVFEKSQFILPEEYGYQVYYPAHGLPLATDANNAAIHADSGIFFLRALSCFLLNPTEFFTRSQCGTSLNWGSRNNFMTAALRITRETMVFDQHTVDDQLHEEALDKLLDRNREELSAVYKVPKDRFLRKYMTIHVHEEVPEYVHDAVHEHAHGAVDAHGTIDVHEDVPTAQDAHAYTGAEFVLQVPPSPAATVESTTASPLNDQSSYSLGSAPMSLVVEPESSGLIKPGPEDIQRESPPSPTHRPTPTDPNGGPSRPYFRLAVQADMGDDYFLHDYP